MPAPLLSSAPALAVAGQPLFGNIWLALLSVSAAIAALVAAVAFLGRWLAATHPAPTPKPAPAITIAAPAAAGAVGGSAATANRPPEVAAEVAPELVPVLLAAVAAFYGGAARVVSIRPAAGPAPVAVPSLEALMQQWSYEGRRQIYSSHKVR